MRSSSWSRCNGRLLLAIFLFVGFLSRLAAQGFINGSFETGDTTGWYSINSSGATIPFAASVTDGSDWGAQNRRATDGTWFLQVTDSGSFFQDVSTIPGATYHVSFDFQMALNEPPGYYWSATWDGNEVIRRDGVAAWRWNHFSTDVTAISEVSRFSIDYNAYNWYQFDNIQISSVPESPATSAIFASLLLIGGVAHWARRKVA